MGVKRPVDFRFPQQKRGFTQGGSHQTANRSWTTALDTSNKRGTMYLRTCNQLGGNAYTYCRVTVDGVANIFYNKTHNQNYYTYIFDFNESVKIEHYLSAYYESRVEYAYYEYRP